MTDHPQSGPGSVGQPVVIIGAGLVGCLLAIALAQRGLRVVIFERNRDLRSMGEPLNRPSINMTLCVRGLSSLEKFGALNCVRGLLTPAYTRVVHLADRTLSYQPYGGLDDAIHSVKRNALNSALMTLAEQLGVTIHFGFRCVAYDLATTRLTLAAQDGTVRSVEGSCVVGADGAFSRLRAILKESGLLSESVEPSKTGYKALTIPLQKQAQLQKNAVHVWPRQQSMAVGFPNVDGSHSIGFHVPIEGDESFAQLADETSVKSFFATRFEDIFPHLADSATDFALQRPNSMLTVRCRPWTFEGKVLLIGDAAHAILPHFGQGGNAGFEDCTVLVSLLDRYGPDWKKVFADFEEIRRPDTDTIADLCCEHAQNLHYSVGSREFDLRLRVEKRLHQMFPRQIIPLYTMISFSNMRYSELRERDRLQRALLDQLMNDSVVEEQFEDQRFLASLQKQIERDFPIATGT